MLSIYLNKDPQGRLSAGFSLTIISEPVFHKLLNSNLFISLQLHPAAHGEPHGVASTFTLQL